MSVVVGIFPDLGTVHGLVDNLKAGGYDLERLRVISPDEASDEIIGTGVEFVYSGEAEEVSLGPGGLITSLSGASVPGLTDTIPRQQPFRNRGLADNLGELEISDARLDDYLEAIDRGRTVAGFNASPDNVAQLKALFASSGATLVETF